MTLNLTVKFAGVGGQGIQLAGKLLGQAAFEQGLNVSQGVAYEPSTSGGLTVADVTLAPLDQEIVYPFLETPDILIVFAQRAWDDYKSQVTDHSVVLADLDNVQEFDGPEADLAKLAFHLPFSAKARELGSEKVTNVVVIGFLSEMLDIGENYVPNLIHASHPKDSEEYELLEVSPENFEDSVIKASPSKYRELNLKAYKVGYQMSLDHDYAREKLDHLKTDG